MKKQPDSSLSFLDVLACALGGSSLLFLILTTLPHTGGNAPKAADALTVSTVEVAPAIEGALARPAPKLFRIEHPTECQLSLGDSPPDAVELGRTMVPTAQQRVEHWLRLGPPGERPVKSIELNLKGCIPGENFVIHSIHPMCLEPIIVEITANAKLLTYQSDTADTWSIR